MTPLKILPVQGLYARTLRLAFFLPFLLFAVSGLLPAQGQGFPSITPDQMQQMQQMQQQAGPRQPAVPGDTGMQPNLLMQPDTSNLDRVLPPSRLEQIISQRAGAMLRQFGYDQLGSGRQVTLPQTGAVQNDYILGVGDEIVVSLRGQENNELRVSVDRNGQVLLPRLSPVPAAGRTLGDLAGDVRALVQRGYISTDAFVSIARVRQISVLVSGEVNNPGQRLLTGLSSVVDALLLSGGIRKSGSLRNVRIQRAGREIPVDLYSVITSRGVGSAMRLADGDRILVPLLGPTVAVSGLVRQPGIYELAQRQSAIAVSDLLQLAGGEEVRGLYRMSIMRIGADGRSNLANAQTQSASLRDSEILFVQLGANQVMNQATLAGSSGLAGSYALSNMQLSEMLRAPGALGDTPYSLFGLIVRRSPQTMMRTFIPFTPVAVLAGRENMLLQGDDLVRIFSTSEAILLDYIMRSYLARLSEVTAGFLNPLDAPKNSEGLSADFRLVQQDAQRDRQIATASSFISNVPPEVQRSAIISLLDLPAPGSALASARADQLRRAREIQPLAAISAASPAAVPQQAPARIEGRPSVAPAENNGLAANFQGAEEESARFAMNREVQTFGQLLRQLNVEPLVLINFLVEHRARLDGAVRGPGDYLIGPSTSLQDMVQAAGGTVGWADQKGVELITTLIDREGGKNSTILRSLPLNADSLVSYIVKPSDIFRFSPITSNLNGFVTVQGEVRTPGAFSILRGDRLSDVLARAGGLTEVAYPIGTVFLRQSVAQQEREGYARAAREIQDQLLVAMTRPSDTRMDPSAYASMQSLVQQLREQRALGRISIVADPSILASQRDLDLLMESGDTIYIPQRPSTVAVLGQVLQPGNFPYRPGESISSYIERAGGLARFADEGQTFLVLPDGTAQRSERSWFRFDTASNIPPGSTIVVTRDVSPFDLRQTVLDISQIMSQLAISLASVSVISK